MGLHGPVILTGLFANRSFLNKTALAGGVTLPTSHESFFNNAVQSMIDEVLPRQGLYSYPLWDNPEPLLDVLEYNVKLRTLLTSGIERQLTALPFVQASMAEKGEDNTLERECFKIPFDKPVAWGWFDELNIFFFEIYRDLIPNAVLINIIDSNREELSNFLFDEFQRKIKSSEGFHYHQDGEVLDETGAIPRQMHTFNVFGTDYNGPRSRFSMRCSSPRGALGLIDLYDRYWDYTVKTVGESSCLRVTTDEMLNNPKQVSQKIRYLIEQNNQFNNNVQSGVFCQPASTQKKLFNYVLKKILGFK